MAHLVSIEANKALNEVGKIDGGYYITKNLWHKFLETAHITEDQVKQFGTFMPGGYVSSNTYYNMLLMYILVFVELGIYRCHVTVCCLFSNRYRKEKKKH